MIAEDAEGQQPSEQEAASRPPAAKRGFDLPRSIYVFLALLIASYVTPPLLKQVFAPAIERPNTQAELSDSDFARYVTAETNVRTAFATSGDGSKSESDPLATALNAAIGGRRKTLLLSARADYEAIARTTHSPKMDRRVLVLDHALDRRLDENLLAHQLRPDLHLAGASSAKIEAELVLWRSLYGTKRVSPDAALKSETLIRDMGLHFLEARARADLWSAANNPPAKAAAERTLQTAAARFMRGEAAVSVLYVIAFLIGAGLQIVFFYAAISGRWQSVHRVATAPLHLLWGELLNAFVFYLALYRFVGLIAGFVIRLTGVDLGAHQLLVLEAGMQISTGAAAVAYLAGTARRRGATLAEIGLTTRGSLLREVGYGIAGYLAGMPFVIVMGLISRILFQHNTNTAPNPILPLIVGVHDPMSRALIFVMASLAAPFFEEIFFRGALFTGLRTRYGWSVSALISALCFALVHPMQDWLPIFALGFTFATMREMRQSLVPGMTAHFLQNTLTFAVLSGLFSS